MKTLGFFLATTLLLTANSLSAENDERWETQRLWREKIEKGLSEKEVMAVLGKPLYVQRSSTETIMFYQFTRVFTAKEREIAGRKVLAIGDLHFSNYGTVTLSNEIKEEKPQIKAEQAQKEKEDTSRARKRVERQARVAEQKGEYYDTYDPRKIEKNKRNNDELSEPIHKVVGWVEPDWNNVDNRDSIFSFPDKKTIKLEKWQDSLAWKRLRLNLSEEFVLKTMGEPSRQNKGVQSDSNAENIKQPKEGVNRRQYPPTFYSRSLGNEEWLLYGDERFGGILKFRYDHKEAKYMLAYWSEPYWPEIVKQIPKADSKPAEPNTLIETDKVNTKR